MASVFFLLLVTGFLFRNHLRLYVLKEKAVVSTDLKFVETIDEGYFFVDIFECKRNYYSKVINIYNLFFDDKIQVIRFPVTTYFFKNVVLPPIGKDSRNNMADIYFNTLFFDSNYIAMSGIIDEKNCLNDKYPQKMRLGIDENGLLSLFSNKKNSKFIDVLQAPHTFTPRTKGNLNFRDLNYRQFVALKDGQFLYITGYKNSLISWVDIKVLMQIKNIDRVIPLDGGASLDYFFAGRFHTYQFSSIPMRNLWYKNNSPYYLEGTLNNTKSKN